MSGTGRARAKPDDVSIIIRFRIRMTVIVKSKEPLVVPVAARRKAGFKSGQELEVKASGGVITIVPKVSPDELQDEREIRDPRIRKAIRQGHAEFLAGRTAGRDPAPRRPIEEFFGIRARKRAPLRPRA